MPVKDGLMLCLVLLLALMLTGVTTLGNAAQSNGKKSPIKLLRNNTSTKDANGGKPSSPQSPQSTAIDPLSHVWHP